MLTQLKSGIPLIRDYSEIRQSSLFVEMEMFSDRFLDTNKDLLAKYAEKWCADPFHWFSRQWEYPFVLSQIKAHLSNGPDGQQAVILDAGSGVTFFPYYLASELGVQVKCCDRDTDYVETYAELNKTASKPINFTGANIRALPYEDNSMDVVYCISVLEHTRDYERVLKEFHRVLKNNGLLVLTFDIALRGTFDIPVEGAEALLNSMHTYFLSKNGGQTVSLRSLISAGGILTTDYVSQYQRDICPKLPPLHWRLLSSAKGLVRRGHWKRWSYNLTCFCGAFSKVQSKDDSRLMASGGAH